MVGDITLTGIQKLLARTSEGNGLRVQVVEEGCSGIEYKMVVDMRATEDRMIAKNGARIFMNKPEACFRLRTHRRNHARSNSAS